MAQNRFFKHKTLPFEKLSFECFVAGEARIIEKASDPVAVLIWLKFLQKVCYWKAGGASWAMVRAMYTAICRCIEDQEANWLTPIKMNDSMIYINYELIAGFKQKNKQDKSPHKSKIVMYGTTKIIIRQSVPNQAHTVSITKALLDRCYTSAKKLEGKKREK